MRGKLLSFSPVHMGGFIAEEMGDDEVVALVISAIIAIIGAVMWYAKVLGPSLLRRRPPLIGLLTLAPIACVLIIYCVLRNWSDPVVKDDLRYVLLFLASGGAFLSIFGLAIPQLGLSLSLDVVNQRNPAAVVTIVGGMIGVTLAYALANIGSGPTIWTTIGPAVLACGALLVLWAIAEMAGDFSEAVTIERDVASGLRLAVFLICGGLILGRAVAGDYVSAEATFHDFAAQGWMALPLAVAAAMVQRILRPTGRNPQPAIMAYGLAPSLALLLAAILWVWHLGKW